MGSIVSCMPRYGCCVPRRAPDKCKENHTTYTSTPRRGHYENGGVNGGGGGGGGGGKSSSKKHRRNLSAAFNMVELETSGAGGDGMVAETVELLNINSATEEELMTLPGINRQTAHNIVEYRKQLGAFKKVEDLALVSGVGATKLSTLRPEICVRSKSSMSSSTSSSRQDLSMMQDDISRSSSKSAAQQIYSVNSSNVFQLTKVKGISQPLAENIVMYREKKGPYRTLEDLLKVKGIKPYVFSTVRPFLTVEEIVNNTGMGIDTTGIHITCNPSQSNLLEATGDSQEDMISLYGPLTKKSFRGGKRKQQYFAKRNSRPVMRIGSWNLQQCAEEKTLNPGVKEVVAMTILENGLGILGVQELGDTEALQKLCEELNHPSIPAVRKFQGHRGVWKCVTSPPAGGTINQTPEHLGFLYDCSRGVELVSMTLLENTADGQALNQRPFIGMFRVREFDVAVINVHLQLGERLQGQTERLNDVITAIQQHLEGEQDIVLLGDFDRAPDSEDFVALRERGYQNVLAADKYTNISMRNPEGSRSYDNVWMGPHMAKVYTGTCDVIREGLTSPWIPNGWGWGGLASDHCPVWAEFYTDGDFERSGDATPISVKDIQCALRMGVADL